MRVLSIILIIVAIVMGYLDGGDMTAAVILGVLFLPTIIGRKERRKGGKGKRGCYHRSNPGNEAQRAFEKTC